MCQCPSNYLLPRKIERLIARAVSTSTKDASKPDLANPFCSIGEGKAVGLSGGNVSVERAEALRMPKGTLDDGGGVRYNTFEAYQSTLRSGCATCRLIASKFPFPCELHPRRL